MNHQPSTINQARWAAFVPALMSSVLLFMDQNITVRLVDSPAHKLKKGYGLHLVRPLSPATMLWRHTTNDCSGGTASWTPPTPPHTIRSTKPHHTTGHAGYRGADLRQLALRPPLACGSHRALPQPRARAGPLQDHRGGRRGDRVHDREPPHGCVRHPTFHNTWLLARHDPINS